MAIEFEITLEIFGISGTAYPFIVHKRLEERDFVPLVFLTCRWNELSDAPKEYVVRGITYTKNFGNFVVKHKLFHPHITGTGMALAYYYGMATKEKDLIFIKEDILQNKIEYPEIQEFTFNDF